MRRAICFLLMTFLFCKLIAATPVETNPEFHVVSLDGNEISSKSLIGKPYIVNFFASWNPVSQKEIPYMVTLQNKFSLKGFTFIGVAINNTEPAIRDFIKNNKITYPVVLSDQKIFNTFSSYVNGGMTALPTSFVVNSSGQITQVIVGGRFPVETGSAHLFWIPQPGVKSPNRSTVKNWEEIILESLREWLELSDNNPELAILKGKITFRDNVEQEFSALANDEKPTQNEKIAILKWEEIREKCINSAKAARSGQSLAMLDQFANNVRLLVVDLYAGRISYGSFARQRAEYTSRFMSDEQRFMAQQQAQQAAQQRDDDAQQRATDAAAMQQIQSAVNQFFKK